LAQGTQAGIEKCGVLLVNVAKEQGLIEAGIPGPGGTWGDFGSGTGIFTVALSNLIGSTGEIYSVDRDGAALATQQRVFSQAAMTGRVHFLVADFTEPIALPPMDGIVMANSLHFIDQKKPVLAQAMSYLKPGGRLIVVEYNTSFGNHWVPYPIPLPSLQRLAMCAGFAAAHPLATIPSSFLGEMYSCLCIRESPSCDGAREHHFDLLRGQRELLLKKGPSHASGHSVPRRA
jgi:SAM-dependent methyltransferase